MTQHSSTSSRRLRRLALLAALLVIVRVLGWELHQLAAPHASGQACEVCLVAERCGDALPTAPAVSPAPPQMAPSAAGSASLPRAIAGPCPPARGPPSLQA